MNVNLTGREIDKPDNMPLKAQLAWDYLKINNGGWIAVYIGGFEDAILVTDESGDLGNGFICRTGSAFVGFLESTAEDHLHEDAVGFLCSAKWVDPRLFVGGAQGDALLNAVLDAIKAEDGEED